MDLNDKIMEAMIFSGKGRTPETPIFSLGIADGEYFIPNVGFKIETDGQKEKKDTEWNKDGNFVEVITALVDNVNVRKYYFIIQHAKQKIDDDAANELAAKKAEKEKKAEKNKKKAKDKKTTEIQQNKTNMQIDSIPTEIKTLLPVSDSIQTIVPDQKITDTIPTKSVN